MRRSLYRPIPNYSGLVRWWAVGLLIGGVAFAFVARPASGQATGVTGTECCLELLLPIGARSVSLGQSMTARANRDGFFYNPASIAGYGKRAVVIHHENAFYGQNTTFSGLIDLGLAGAVGLTYVHIEKLESPATGPGGEETGRISDRVQQLIVSWATSMGAGVRAGANFRWFRSGTSCAGFCQGTEGTGGSTALVDLGVQYGPRLLRSLELGAAFTHLGPGLQVRNAAQADPTPARFRVGVDYEVAHLVRPDSQVTVWLSADIVNRLRSPTTPAVGIGLEVIFERAILPIYLRAGYSGSGDALMVGGGGLGIGMHYQRFTIDIARSFTPLAAEAEQYLISFGITF